MFYPHILLQKSLCLLGVVFFHALIPFTTPIPFWKLYAAESRAWADQLVMIGNFLIIPSFVFASGFLLARGRAAQRDSFFRAVQKRAKRLLLPWFMTMLFWLVPLYVLLEVPAYQHPANASLLDTYSLGLRGLFVDHLWFLLVLFWTSLFWLVCLPLVEKWGRAAGCILAVGAAVLMENFGQKLTWYCLWETTGPLIYFYLGYLVYHSQQRVDALLTRRMVPCFLAMAAVVALCSLWATQHYAVVWLLSCVGCLFTYQCSLLTIPAVYDALQKKSWFVYFEKNAFRYYLFHMPPALLVFMALNRFAELSPLPFVALSFALTLTITTGVVWASRAFDTA